MKAQELTKFFDLIPPELKAQTYIAGGAAVPENYAVDSDIDFFVLSQIGTKADEHEATLRATFDAWWPNLAKSLNIKAYPFEVTARSNDEAEEYTHAARVLYDGVYIGRKFQIMASTEDTIHNLLNSFDLSVHMVAVDQNGLSFATERTTGPRDIIRVHNVVNPNTTLVRYRKLYKRYLPSGIDHNGIAELIKWPLIDEVLF